jgi:hypothetical protein
MYSQPFIERQTRQPRLDHVGNAQARGPLEVTENSTNRHEPVRNNEARASAQSHESRGEDPDSGACPREMRIFEAALPSGTASEPEPSLHAPPQASLQLDRFKSAPYAGHPGAHGRSSPEQVSAESMSINSKSSTGKSRFSAFTPLEASR